MKRSISLLVGAIAISLVAFSAKAENPLRPIGRNPGTPAPDRAVEVRDPAAAAAPDNTARNVRDRDDRTLTPFDQGNGPADTDTTAQIRRAILAGEDMSVNAQNVKIITSDGRVTLRGPVASAEEKRLIGEIANRIARSENVDNQLEVVLKD